VDRVVVGDHRREAEAAGDLAGQRRADDAAGVADDERHLLRRRVRGGDDQVTLVLAVVVVGDDDDLAAAKGLDGLTHTRHAFYPLLSSSNPFAARKRGLFSRSLAIVRRHNIARAAAARDGEFSKAPLRRSTARRSSPPAASPLSTAPHAPYKSAISAVICACQSPPAPSRRAIAIAVSTRGASR